MEKKLSKFDLNNNQIPNKASFEFAHMVASELHDDFRKQFKEASWEYIKDKKFVSLLKANELPNNIRLHNGQYQMDIVHSTYDELSPDLQYESKEFGQCAADLVIRNQEVKTGLTEEQVGDEIHKKWLTIYPYLKGDPFYDLPFKILPKNIQNRLLNKYKIANSVAEQLKEQGKALQNIQKQNGPEIEM